MITVYGIETKSMTDELYAMGRNVMITVYGIETVPKTSLLKLGNKVGTL